MIPLFRQSADSLSDDADFVLLLVGLSPTGLSEPALRVATDPEKIDLATALQELDSGPLSSSIAGSGVIRWRRWLENSQLNVGTGMSTGPPWNLSLSTLRGSPRSFGRFAGGREVSKRDALPAGKAAGSGGMREQRIPCGFSPSLTGACGGFLANPFVLLRGTGGSDRFRIQARRRRRPSRETCS